MYLNCTKATINSKLRTNIRDKTGKTTRMTNLFDLQDSITAANGNATLAKDLFTMLLNELESRLKQIKTCFYDHDLTL